MILAASPYCRRLSTSEPYCDIKPYYHLVTVRNSSKALTVFDFSKNESKNTAETCAINFKYPTSTLLPI